VKKKKFKNDTERILNWIEKRVFEIHEWKNSLDRMKHNFLQNELWIVLAHRRTKINLKLITSLGDKVEICFFRDKKHSLVFVDIYLL
jgi:hypothetical protein